MADKKKKPHRLKARQPRGFVDRSPEDIRATDAMMAKIKEVYERYGFDPVETPMFEYTDALGKFLPDTDRPNAGVFSLQDDDEQWMSLRYDLTAPLARHFAQNINELQTPYRTYRAGWVFRNEKPGPGRFRQFMQFDADTVGAPGPSADAEMCMMMADTMEALGLEGQFLVRVNSRKVLDGILDAIGLAGEQYVSSRLTVLRSLDKFDRVGLTGVKRLLMDGRVDESGDFTKGAGLDAKQTELLLSLLKDQSFAFLLLPDNLAIHESKTYEEYVENFEPDDLSDFVDNEEDAIIEPSDLDEWNWMKRIFVDSEATNRDASIKYLNSLEFNKFAVNRKFRQGIRELIEIIQLCNSGGYSALKIRPDVTCVRGLEYYTGAVYECELTFPVTNEKGEEVVFGSVAGGGRYDGLVKRFTGQDIPATGFSIGVSRLMTALKNLGKLEASETVAPVVVCVMDRDTEALADYQKMVQELRNAGIRSEMYQGNPKQFGKQLQYADRRGSPIAVIAGSEERANGKVQIKDLIEGARMAEEITDNEEWRAMRPAQQEIDRADLVAKVTEILARQKADREA
ncbi:histidine--tRNA ligase [Pseudahrensia aquimaris]|uniref:Histidine--tRNA ligase n=1 Tax=Pseudahrensia aquimaris TaxID=744461 RepID=A0ABW3FH83_9HYPH